MAVLAIVASVGANPVESILVVLNRIDEGLTGDDSVGHLSDLLTRVTVDIDVGGLFILKRQVVGVFTLLPLFADTSLEIGAQLELVVENLSCIISLELNDTLK